MRSNHPRVSIAAIRQAAASARAEGRRATCQAVARRLGLPASTIRLYAQSCVALYDTFDADRSVRVEVIPRVSRKDIENTIMLKWLIRRLDRPDTCGRSPIGLV